MLILTLSLIILFLLVRKNPNTFFLLNIIFFVFVSKLLSISYASEKNFIYSREAELYFNIYPDAILTFSLTFIILISITYFINSFSLSKNIKSIKFTLTEVKLISNSFYYLSTLLIIALFINLLLFNEIPFFNCKERFEFSSEINNYFIRYLPLISFLIGFFSIFKASNNKLDYKYALLICSIFLYLMLTGHRFSSYFQVISYYFIPFAAKGYFNYDFLKKNKLFIYLVFTLIVFIFLSLFNSHFNVRQNNFLCNESDKNITSNERIPFSKQIQEVRNESIQQVFSRIFILPTDIYFLSYNRILKQENYDFKASRDFVFSSYYDSNTSIRLLMNNSLSKERALYLKKIGNQAGGGFPEILFELVQFKFYYPTIILISLITAFLFKFLSYMIVKQNIFSAFSIIYVLYSFIVFLTGGMIAFIINPFFWLKVCTMIIISAIEFYLNKQNKNLLSILINFIFICRKKIKI